MWFKEKNNRIEHLHGEADLWSVTSNKEGTVFTLMVMGFLISGENGMRGRGNILEGRNMNNRSPDLKLIVYKVVAILYSLCVY